MNSLSDISIVAIVVHPHVWSGLRSTVVPLVQSLESHLREETLNLELTEPKDIITYIFDVHHGQDIAETVLTDIGVLAQRAPVLAIAPGLTFAQRAVLFSAGAAECVDCSFVIGFGAAFRRAATDALARRAQHMPPSATKSAKAVSSDVSSSNTTANSEHMELRRRNQKLQEFVGLVAHDLRVPLDNIVALANYLSTPAQEADPRALALEIHDSGSIALDLVNDLLDLTAIETGLLVLDVEPFDVKDFLKHVVRLHETPLRRKSLKLEIELRDDVMACGDRKRISQVLHNLITNAIKFTPEGGRITLKAENCADGVRLEVCDSGVGIASAAIPRLFDKFEKVSTPGTDGEAGTGFGLPLSQEIVLAHGSSLSVESSKDAGTRFWFFLPSAISPDDAQETHEQVESNLS